MSSSSTPAPDKHTEAATAHRQALEALVVEQIARAGGSISFAEYMQAALYTPGLGYYMGGARRFGPAGDFVTAPEISDLFGATLAGQIAQVLDSCDSAQRAILELGAGSGRLAADLLAALPGDTRYAILEPSASLREEQQRLLQARFGAAILERVVWLDTLPASHTGVILANEVADALPVERVYRQANGEWRQIRVRCRPTSASDGEHGEAAFPVFSECDAVAPDWLRSTLSGIEHELPAELGGGYRTEVSGLLAPWIASLADALSYGAILLIDYGYPRSEYYLPERRDGTLQCFRRHRAHGDVFRDIGLQDITAHVDFTAVAEAAMASGLSLLGYTSQSAFLRESGLADLAASRMAAATAELARLGVAEEVRKLTLPGEMGERFQVMLLGRGYDRPPDGFDGEDLSYRL